jgi:hypothetical protein
MHVTLVQLPDLYKEVEFFDQLLMLGNVGCHGHGQVFPCKLDSTVHLGDLATAELQSTSHGDHLVLEVAKSFLLLD